MPFSGYQGSQTSINIFEKFLQIVCKGSKILPKFWSAKGKGLNGSAPGYISRLVFLENRSIYCILFIHRLKHFLLMTHSDRIQNPFTSMEDPHTKSNTGEGHGKYIHITQQKPFLGLCLEIQDHLTLCKASWEIVGKCFTSMLHCASPAHWR